MIVNDLKWWEIGTKIQRGHFTHNYKNKLKLIFFDHLPLVKFLNNVILFVGLTTLGLLMNLIGWFVKFSVQTFQPLMVIYRRGNFFIIIVDAHQFIGHCLILSDLCV